MGVIPDIVLPSRNNYLEVGEASLENPLSYDTIDPVPFEKLNRIQPVLADLREKSTKRLDADKDFAYVREDIELTKRALADKSVSLNEEQRLKEKQEEETRTKARQAEVKSRSPVDEKIYEITLKAAELAGLPPAVGSTNSVAKTEAATPPAHDEGDEEEHRRKEHRHCGQRLDADHLAEIDVVDGAEQRLQDIARHHRQQEEEEVLPERGGGDHGHACAMGAAHRAARRWRF